MRGKAVDCSPVANSLKLAGGVGSAESAIGGPWNPQNGSVRPQLGVCVLVSLVHALQSTTHDDRFPL